MAANLERSWRQGEIVHACLTQCLRSSGKSSGPGIDLELSRAKIQYHGQLQDFNPFHPVSLSEIHERKGYQANSRVINEP
jgi:hypothetical protein